jgi:vitamin B12 transporter
MQNSSTGKLSRILACASLITGLCGPLSGQEDLVELTAFTVYAGAQTVSGGQAVQLSDRMAREARVDLQSRGGTRYQTDISIRGGIFEGTGLMVGGLALFDPQTGHYFSEIPLDPAFFGGAYLLTGVENGIHGFNSTAGSINWQWAPIRDGGQAFVRAGSNNHIGGGVRAGGAAGSARYEISLTSEQGDGSVENGDFDLTRLSGRMEYTIGEGTLRVFGGYLQKFYGWPGMYTGFPLNETDDYSVSLLGWQYKLTGEGDGSSHRVGGYWRRIDDDYEYKRETPNNYFEHLTEVYSLQGDGVFAMDAMELVYRWAYVTDRIARSTSLVNGDFSERDYGEAALLGRHRIDTRWGELQAYAGMALDTTNEDATVGLPQAGIRAEGISQQFSWTAYLEYAESSQVPGYTVLNSAGSGLFGGDKNLGRERASSVEAGFSIQTDSVSAKLVAFQRKDEGLIDWVFDSGSPSARKASPVDIEVRGVEGLLRWDLGETALELGYAWLDKDEEYRNPGVDASFYALNYARHRILATLEHKIGELLSLRIEGEYRKHPDNFLRQGGDEAMRLNAELSVPEVLGSDFDLVLRGNNLTKEHFQTVPGTRGAGREAYLTLSYGW